MPDHSLAAGRPSCRPWPCALSGAPVPAPRVARSMAYSDVDAVMNSLSPPGRRSRSCRRARGSGWPRGGDCPARHLDRVAGRGQHAAVHVDPEPVGDTGRDLREQRGFASCRRRDVVGADVVVPGPTVPEAGRGVRDVGGRTRPARRRGRSALRPRLCDLDRPGGSRVEPEDAVRRIRGRRGGLRQADNSVGRVAEPDRAVGLDHHIVRRVEPPPSSCRRPSPRRRSGRSADRRCPARRPPRGPAGPGRGRSGTRRPSRGDPVHRRRPAQEPVAGDVAPDHGVVVWQVDRALRPHRPRHQPLEPRRSWHEVVEAQARPRREAEEVRR